MLMNPIKDVCRFPETDPAAETYFEDYKEGTAEDDRLIRPFGFRTIRDLKELIRARSGGTLSNREIAEAAVTVFRCRPEERTAEAPKDRQVVDFNYQL